MVRDGNGRGVSGVAPVFYGAGMRRLRLECKRKRIKKIGTDNLVNNGGGAAEPRDLREAHNRQRGRPSDDKNPSSLADFGIIHTIGNEAAQERGGGATEPPASLTKRRGHEAALRQRGGQTTEPPSR